MVLSGVEISTMAKAESTILPASVGNGLVCGVNALRGVLPLKKASFSGMKGLLSEVLGRNR